MDPTIADALDELRQAGAFTPGILPPTAFRFPQSPIPPPQSFAPMTPAPESRWIEQPATLSPDRHQALIAEVQAMMASNDPRQRAMAEIFLAQHGRNLFGMGANRATWVSATN